MHTWLSELDQFTQPRIHRISDLQDSNLRINRRTERIDGEGNHLLYDANSIEIMLIVVYIVTAYKVFVDAEVPIRPREV